MITKTENKTPNMLAGLFSECFQDKPLVNPRDSGYDFRQQSAEFFNAPHMICDSSFHCGSHSKSLVNAAKIVVHEVDRNHMAVVLDLLSKVHS
jgi:hypothetical protein